MNVVGSQLEEPSVLRHHEKLLRAGHSTLNRLLPLLGNGAPTALRRRNACRFESCQRVLALPVQSPKKQRCHAALASAIPCVAQWKSPSL